MTAAPWLALLAVAALFLSGCTLPAGPTPPPGVEDLPLRWVDAERYAAPHTFAGIGELLAGWARDHPDVVRVETLGRSVEGRPLLAARLGLGADEADLVAFVDGGHHANEVEGIEQVLYAGDFLLANLGNATIRGFLERTDVLLLPVVNPDGLDAAGLTRSRGNARGVNLNRNYDVDWGNPAGSSTPALGGTGAPTGVIVAENPGTAPFSEPEARAVRDALAAAGPRLAFYVTMHTQAHSVLVPWAAFEPPRPVPEEHEAVFDEVLGWVREHTEYLAGRGQWGDLSTGAGYAASGTSYDWAYFAHGKPAFLFEQSCCSASADADDSATWLQPRTLDDWMRAGTPFLLYLLANAPSLARWELPEDTSFAPAP